MRGGEVESARARRPRTAAAARSRPTGSSARCPPSARAGCGRPRCSRADPVARADGRALRRLDERDPVLPRRKPFDIIRGHLTFIDAPWALTALTQAPVLGRPRLRARLRRRRARSTASRSTSPTGTRPGSSTASRRSSARAKQVAKEVLEQIKLHLNDNGEDILTDDMVALVVPRPGDQVVTPARGATRNDEPLLVNTVGTWEKRPKAQHRDPEPVPGRRLRADRHRPGDDGGRERVRPRGRQRAARGVGLEGRAGDRCTSSTTRPSSRPRRPPTRELYKQGQPNAARQGLGQRGLRQRVVLRPLRAQRRAVERQLRRPERLERRRVRRERLGAPVALHARERHVRPERPLLRLVEAARLERVGDAPAGARTQAPSGSSRSSAKRRGRRGGTGTTSPGARSGASPGGRASWPRLSPPTSFSGAIAEERQRDVERLLRDRPQVVAARDQLVAPRREPAAHVRGQVERDEEPRARRAEALLASDRELLAAQQAAQHVHRDRGRAVADLVAVAGQPHVARHRARRRRA